MHHPTDRITHTTAFVTPVVGSTRSPTGIGSRRRVVSCVMEFRMSRWIKPKEKYVRISMKEIWRNLDGPPKNKELWSYVVSFEYSRPKVAQIGPYIYTPKK